MSPNPYLVTFTEEILNRKRQKCHCHLCNVRKIQKQPSRHVFKKSCSEYMQQIYRRTLMPKCDFSKVALQFY